MGKRRDPATSSRVKDESADETSSPVSSHKKHKKHKKKHHKRENVEEEGLFGDQDDMVESPKGPIKLKLKIGTETLGTKNVVTVKQEPTDAFVNVTDDLWDEDDGYDPSKKTKKAGDDTSDEEKEWLTALEKGELDDYGEVSKGQKDPALMTARQRALKHGTQEQELLQLPTGYRQVELTEEQLKRREQRAHKRKLKAHEKREKDKRQTIDRLLKKQDSKKAKMRTSRKSEAPKVTYINSISGISISVPEGVEFPFPAQATPTFIAPPRCSVTGCKNIKKYSCSKTGVPLCSLQCYKKNLAAHKLTSPGLVTT